MARQEEEHNREIYLSAIRRLRNITMLVKIASFSYTAVYLLCMIGYIYCSDEVSSLLDMLFYVSPLTCMMFFCMSYILKFCNWYRLQCVLPAFPLPLILVDEYIYRFDYQMAEINICIFIAIFVLSLVNTYILFLR